MPYLTEQLGAKNIVNSNYKQENLYLNGYLILPVMVLLSTLLPPPRIKIKEVHAICPSTGIRTKLCFDKGV